MPKVMAGGVIRTILGNEVNQLPWYLLDYSLRKLASKNANAICKDFLTFYESKVSASKNAKHYYCKKFYNSATVQF